MFFRNKKLITAFLSMVLLSVPGVLLAVAFDPANPPGIPLSTANFWTVMVRILGLIWPIFIGLSMIMMLVSGFLFLTAQGEASKVRAARDSLIWASIGVVVGILAFSLPFIIGTAVGL